MRPSDLGAREGRWILLGVLLLGFSWACASAPAYLQLGEDELWEDGVQAFEEEDWDAAIQLLQRLVLQYPGYLQAPEARIYIARAFVGRGEYITGASEFERFLQIYRNHGLAPEASFGVCQAYAALAPHPQRDQSHTAQAREACEETWLNYRGLTVAQSADSIRAEMVSILAQSDYQNADFYQDYDMHNSAIMGFEEVLSLYPESDWAPRALLGIYRSYVSLGWDPEADETSARLLAEYPDSESARELRVELDGEAGASRDAGVDR